MGAGYWPMTNLDPSALYSPAAVAAFHDAHRDTVLRAIHAGRLPAEPVLDEHGNPSSYAVRGRDVSKFKRLPRAA